MSLRKISGAVAAVVVFVTASIALASVPSDTIIDTIGGDNAYFLMFALGTVGGLTTFTGIPYHFILMSLAAGGISPLLLGIATGLGVVVGDSTMFLIGRQVRSSLPSPVMQTMGALTGLIERHPRMLAPALTCYGALSPFSNDFVVASLSVSGYSFRTIIVPLGVGNIAYNVGIAYLGFYGYDTIVSLI